MKRKPTIYHKHTLLESKRGQFFIKFQLLMSPLIYKKIRTFLKGKQMSTHAFFIMAAKELLARNPEYK